MCRRKVNPSDGQKGITMKTDFSFPEGTSDRGNGVIKEKQHDKYVTVFCWVRI